MRIALTLLDMAVGAFYALALGAILHNDLNISLACLITAGFLKHVTRILYD
jgi:hypothetical protein